MSSCGSGARPAGLPWSAAAQRWLSRGPLPSPPFISGAADDETPLVFVQTNLAPSAGQPSVPLHGGFELRSASRISVPSSAAVEAESPAPCGIYGFVPRTRRGAVTRVSLSTTLPTSTSDPLASPPAVSAEDATRPHAPHSASRRTHAQLFPGRTRPAPWYMADDATESCCVEAQYCRLCRFELEDGELAVAGGLLRCKPTGSRLFCH